MRRLFLLLLSLAAASLPAAASLRAQEIRVQGDDRSAAVRVAREIVARGNYLRIDRDTILPRDFRAPGDLVVYDADVRLEGTVEGSVAVLGGDFFIRPGARVGGQIAVVDGGVYTSALATTGAILRAEPGTVLRDADRNDSLRLAGVDEIDVEVIGPPRPGVFSFNPRLPTYDRVNGLTVTAGISLLPTRTEGGLVVDLWGSYRGENEVSKAGGGARVDLPLGVQAFRLVAEASRETRTQDRWLRGDFSNSVAVALNGRDYRNYYDSDRATLMLQRPVDRPLVAGESWFGPRVGVMLSRDRSLRTRDVWSIWENDEKGRPNPPVVEAEYASALAGAEVRWRGRLARFDADATLEHAFSGDLRFTQLVGDVTFEATAVRDHTLTLYFRGMGPLNDDGAPPQRFGILGGGGTLSTLDIGDFRGDHLFFVESLYTIPFPRIQVPVIGSPSLELTYASGAAWQTGDDVPPWVQNVGLGVAFPFFRVRALVDPAIRPLEPKVSFRVSLPFTR